MAASLMSQSSMRVRSVADNTGFRRVSRRFHYYDTRDSVASTGSAAIR